MIMEVALEEAVKWAVPAILTALAIWWGVKRKNLSEWRERRRARNRAFDTMLAGWSDVHEKVSAIDGIATAVGQQGEVLQEVRGVLRTQSDLSDDGQFQCTPAGSNTFVNQTYARLLGVGKADLLGNQWKNYIAPEDRMRFLAANAAALAEDRPFNDRCHMVRSDGDRVLVDVTMYPDPERPPVERWFGRIREVRS